MRPRGNWTNRVFTPFPKSDDDRTRIVDPPGRVRLGLVVSDTIETQEALARNMATLLVASIVNIPEREV